MWKKSTYKSEEFIPLSIKRLDIIHMIGIECVIQGEYGRMMINAEYWVVGHNEG